MRFVGCLAVAALMYPVNFAAAKGDPSKGEDIYEECSGCHAINEHKIGPKHCGLFGRKAGSVADYESYSSVMKESGITWDEKKLDEFLKSPLSYLSGTAMGFVGVANDEHRADLIAYLKKATDPKVCGK